jgi:uncharacterized RDD family membrane protein YckC
MVATATDGVAAPSPRVVYGGIATRGIALAIDALIANGIILITAALLALIGSLVGGLRPAWLVAVIGAVGWALALGAYFTLFWTGAGQTPGMRLMHLRVLGPRGDRPGFPRSVIRAIGLALAIIPLFAGFIPVLFDARRRGLHDLMARTVVVHTS